MATKEFILRQQFEKAAGHIKSLGFTVYITTNSKETHGYFSDGKHIGYFQQNQFAEGVNIATCNKVPGSSGKHHCLDPYFKPVSLTELSKEYLEKGFSLYPEYFSDEDKTLMPVVKYADLDDFLSSVGPGILRKI